MFGGIHDNTLRTSWNLALKKCGYDQRRKNGYFKHHLYTCRKFFRSYSKLPHDNVEYHMGHDLSSEGKYIRLPTDDCRREYLQIMDNLTIFKTDHRHIKSLEEQTAAQQARIEELEARLNEITSTLTRFEERRIASRDRYLEKHPEQRA